MAKIKHKIFQIPINKSLGKISEKYDSGILKEINDFLEDEKRIYLNHSLTTIKKNELSNAPGQSIEDEIAYNYQNMQGTNHKNNYGHYRYNNIDKYVVVSLIYKELEEDELEEGIYRGEPMKLPKTRKSYTKPEIVSEADKFLKEEKKAENKK